MITPGEAATIAAVVDTFVRAIETSDFERRLRLVEADHFDQPGAAAGRIGAGANGYYYNPWARSYCRFAADGGVRNNRCN